MRRFQIVMFGSGGVGKTALVNTFLHGNFPSNYVATIEDRFNKFMNIDGHNVHLGILDTAGTEQFTAMRDLYIKNADGFILVYSITDESSFQYILPLIDLIRMSKDGTVVPIIIVGNKCDLASDRVIYSRQVTNYLSKYKCGGRTLQPRRSIWTRTSYKKTSISVLTSSRGTTPVPTPMSTSMPTTPIPERLSDNISSDKNVSVSMPTVNNIHIKKDDADKKKKSSDKKKMASKTFAKKKKAKRPDNINLDNNNHDMDAKDLMSTCIQFLETSAKEETNVISAFHLIIKEMIKVREEEEEEARKNRRMCTNCSIC